MGRSDDMNLPPRTIQQPEKNPEQGGTIENRIDPNIIQRMSSFFEEHPPSDEMIPKITEQQAGMFQYPHSEIVRQINEGNEREWSNPNHQPRYMALLRVARLRELLPAE